MAKSHNIRGIHRLRSPPNHKVYASTWVYFRSIFPIGIQRQRYRHTLPLYVRLHPAGVLGICQRSQIISTALLFLSYSSVRMSVSARQVHDFGRGLKIIKLYKIFRSNRKLKLVVPSQVVRTWTASRLPT